MLGNAAPAPRFAENLGNLGMSFVYVTVPFAHSFSSLPELHPCPKPCHAPSSCPEVESCPARITLRCACGRLKQTAACGRTAESSSSPRVLPCVPECKIQQRNERLAAALGITPGPDGRASHLAHPETRYSEALQSFWRANAAFAATAEKNLNE